MSNIEEICDEIVILDDGELALSGNLNEIKNQYPKKHINIAGSDIVNVKEYLESDMRGIIKRAVIDEYDLNIHLNEESDRDTLLKAIAQKGFDIDSFRVVKPTLHEIFINVSKEAEQ
jgi:ABC-2 type transport system ATP-binding protein